MSERAWPLSIRVRRCRAWFYGGNAPESNCGRLLWPWQDLRREYDPECGGNLLHHRCHHRSTRGLWEGETSDEWTAYLNCEHRTERLA